MEILDRSQTWQKALVYGIVCMVTGDCYIGASINGYHRASTHRSLLKHGKHTHKRLQELYNEYGDDSFRMYVVKMMEGATEEELLTEESLWIKKCGNLNMLTELGKNGYKQTEESKEKISQALREAWKDPSFRRKKHGMLGHKHSMGTREQMSLSAKKRGYVRYSKT